MGRKHGVVCALVFAAGLCAISASAQEKSNLSLKFGLIERIRNEYYNNIQDMSVYTNDKNDYFRIRTSVWAQAAYAPYATAYVKLTNEFRKYLADPKDRDFTWDEIIFDNLYLKLETPGKLAALTVGRQNLTYGEGFILMEGAPWDGSRTIYHDAVKLALTRGKTTVDLLAIDNLRKDDRLPVIRGSKLKNGELKAQNRDQWLNDGEEKAFGLYATTTAVPKSKLEAYFIRKTELPDPWIPKAGVLKDELNLNTVGGRLSTGFTPRFSLTTEWAYENGTQGAIKHKAYGGYGYLTFVVEPQSKAALSAGVIALSGDDPNRPPRAPRRQAPGPGRFPASTCPPPDGERAQAYLRASSMTLPSLGSEPAATKRTSPRSLVTSRSVASTACERRIRRAVALDAQRDEVVAALVARPRGARARGRGGRTTSRHLLGMHEEAAHLGGLVGAAHPALDAHVRAPAGARARQHRRQVAGGEAHQRIVVVERGDDDLAHLALGHRVAGAGAHDLDDQLLVHHQPFARRGLVGDDAEVGGAVGLVGVDAARRAGTRAPAAGTPRRKRSAPLDRARSHAQLVALLQDQLEERRRADVARRLQVGDHARLHLGLPDAAGNHRAAEVVQPGLEHRARGREVIRVAVEHHVAGAEAGREERARGAPEVRAAALGIVDRARARRRCARAPRPAWR